MEESEQYYLLTVGCRVYRSTFCLIDSMNYARLLESAEPAEGFAIEADELRWSLKARAGEGRCVSHRISNTNQECHRSSISCMWNDMQCTAIGTGIGLRRKRRRLSVVSRVQMLFAPANLQLILTAGSRSEPRGEYAVYSS